MFCPVNNAMTARRADAHWVLVVVVVAVPLVEPPKGLGGGFGGSGFWGLFGVFVWGHLGALGCFWVAVGGKTVHYSGRACKLALRCSR
jgi:hypothetical protein